MPAGAKVVEVRALKVDGQPSRTAHVSAQPTVDFETPGRAKVLAADETVFINRTPELRETCELSPTELTRLYSQWATAAQGETLATTSKERWRNVLITAEQVTPPNKYVVSVAC